MDPGEPSHTALFVAYLRALGSLAPQVPGFSDRMAERLLPPAWSKRVEQARGKLAKRPQRSVFPFGYQGLGLLLEFRTVILDHAIQAALPIEQLVILGAGLDSRAWRLPGLEPVRVYELDLPGIQAWKRACSTRLPPLAREVRLVPMDFTRDELIGKLLAAGYDPRQRTFWLWEGVAMYLCAEEVAQALAAMASLSSPGSQVAMSYLNQREGEVPSSFLLSAIGEPCRSAFAPAELAEAVKLAGWSTLSDSGIRDWQGALAPELSVAEGNAWLQWHERIWIGRTPETC
jgi:methyltransferase (TIGR00027 family)